jgi:hypothetical protein
VRCQSGVLGSHSMPFEQGHAGAGQEMTAFAVENGHDARAAVMAAMSERARALVELSGPLMRSAGGGTASVEAVRAARISGRFRKRDVLVAVTDTSVVLCDRRGARSFPLDAVEIEPLKNGALLRPGETEKPIKLIRHGDVDVVHLLLDAVRATRDVLEVAPAGESGPAGEAAEIVPDHPPAEPAAPPESKPPRLVVLQPRAEVADPGATAAPVVSPYLTAPAPVEDTQQSLVAVRTLLDPVGYVEIDGILRPAVWIGAGATPLRGELVRLAGDADVEPIEVTDAPLSSSEEGNTDG